MRVGPYILDPKPIGSGSQAVVYRAYDEYSGDVVAVKMVSPSRNNFVYQGKLARLRREVEALQALDHPNAPPVLQSEVTGQWFSMPLASRDLSATFGGYRAGWQPLRAGLRGVAEVVAHAHNLGFVHRDLHPGNLLAYPDRWCVADWGFVYSRRGDRLTQQLAAFGVPFYVAPEVLRDPALVRPSADVFAIGRLAERGARIGTDAESDSAAARWWRTLIDGAGAYQESQRWTMVDVLTHLKTPLPMSFPAAVPVLTNAVADDCPNCGSPAGFDATCRCLRCHAVAY